MNFKEEPKEAFPYQPPSEEIKIKYAELFKQKPIKVPLLKLIFDKVSASLILLFASPVLLFLMIFNFFEGLFIPENRVPLVFYYNAVSSKVFKKYKIRLIGG